ncbi:AMP-binding protein [Jatrophihabitans sp. YIM 134969]
MTDAELADNLIHRVNVGDSLTRTAARYPGRTALVEAGRSVTYAEFDALVNRLAQRLDANGYERGDALALASGNSIDFLVVYYACAKLGLVCVPVNLQWKSPEIAYVLGHSQARGIILESQLVDLVAPALAETPSVTDVVVAPGTGADWRSQVEGADWPTLAEYVADAPATSPERFVGDRDPLTYLYTSGTTAAPKGVVGNHTAIHLESLTMCVEAQFRDTDRFVAMLPMFHTAQLNCFCTPAVILGATLFIERAFDAGRLLALIPEQGITHVFGLPMMYRAMLDHPAMATADLSSLRRCCYAMAPMPDAQLDACLEQFGCDFFLLFGQTEMSPTTTIFRPEHQRSHRGAVGTPVVNVQVAIMGEDGALLPTGESGEIVYRGPHALTGYLRDPDATAAAFEHGWFHSGDLGRFGDDGVLWFSDRSKDVIKTGGENVASMEVERALYAADPDIAEVVVVGLPHERWSEAITAFVVPREGATLDQARIIAAVGERLDRYKTPKAVVVVDSLPRTSTGKIQKHVVRREHADLYRS